MSTDVTPPAPATPATAASPASSKKPQYTAVHLVLIVLGIVVAIGSRDRFQYLENRSYDLRLKVAANMAKVPNVSRTVLAPIDDMAVQRYGRWPWARDRWAPILLAMAEVGVDAVAFDVEFPEKSDAVLRSSATGQSFAFRIGKELEELEGHASVAKMREVFSGPIDLAIKEGTAALTSAIQERLIDRPEAVVSWLPGPKDGGWARLASFPVRMLLAPIELDQPADSARLRAESRLRALAHQALKAPKGQRAASVSWGSSKAEIALKLLVDNPKLETDFPEYKAAGLDAVADSDAIGQAAAAFYSGAIESVLDANPGIEDDALYDAVAPLLERPKKEFESQLRVAVAQARARAMTRARAILPLSGLLGYITARLRARLEPSITDVSNELVTRMNGLKSLFARAVRSPDDDFAAAIKQAAQRGMSTYGVFYTEGGLVLEVGIKESAVDAFILDLLKKPAARRLELQHQNRAEEIETRVLRGMSYRPMAGPDEDFWTSKLRFSGPAEFRTWIESARERVLTRALDVELRGRPDLSEPEIFEGLTKIFDAQLTPELVKQVVKLIPSARARALSLKRFLMPISGDLLTESPVFWGFTPPIQDLAREFSGLALSVMAADSDGVMRRVPLVRKIERGLLPGISFRLFLHALGFKADDTAALGKAISIRPGPVVRVERNGKAVEIPIDQQGSALVRMQGEEEVLDRVPLTSVIDYIRLKNTRRELFDNIATDDARAHDALEESADELARAGDKPCSLDAVIAFAKTLGPLKENVVQTIKSGAEKKKEASGEHKPSEWERRIGGWREGRLAGLSKRILDRVANFRKLSKEEQAEKLKNPDWATLLERGVMLESLAFARKQLQETIGGKMVIIGATQTGNTDFGPTPFSPKQANYALHGHGASTLMSGSYIRRPPYRDATLIPILALSLAVGLVLPRVQLGFAALWTAFLALFWAALSTAMLAYRGVWIDMVTPLVALASVYTGLSIWRYYTVDYEKNRFRTMFAAYLDDRVIEQFVNRPELFEEIGGVSLEITAFFSDIEGFTTISEILTPEQLSKMLEDYLSPMTKIITDRGGLRDKYIGDAIVAMFGAPTHDPKHAIQGCLASLEQRDRLAQLKKDPALLGDPKSWLSVLNSKGRDFNARMGVNTGLAKVGNFGSKMSKNYTMIGDTVNLAARLEGANKAFKTYLMISEFTYAQARDYIESRPLDSIRVKGKLRPVTVYELMAKRGGLTQVQEDVRGIYVAARNLYLETRFDEAIAKFKEALKLDPKDGPSITLMERSEHFIHEPPSKDWDGTYDLKEK